MTASFLIVEMLIRNTHNQVEEIIFVEDLVDCAYQDNELSGD